jgi:hypothetical protein
MKKIVPPLLALIMCLVSETAVRAITATTSSPVVALPPGNTSTRSFVQTGNKVMRAPNQARTLTFAERVAYQRAIEDVCWRHRIWPNPEPKAPLDAVMFQAQLETKARGYLRNSQALEDYWQQAITARQLQPEIIKASTR